MAEIIDSAQEYTYLQNYPGHRMAGLLTRRGGGVSGTNYQGPQQSRGPHWAMTLVKY